MAEMKVHEGSMDISQFVQEARGRVAGASLQDAMIRLALIWCPRSVADLRKAVLAELRATPFFSSLPRTKVNRFGKVVAKRGSLMAANPQDRETSLQQAVFEKIAEHHQMAVAAAIQPARLQLVEEHHVAIRDILPVVSASAFVPAGREDIFAAGLAAGFTGDFVVALHLLVPQMENSIRRILEGIGAVTSKVDDEGVQDERDLGYLLYTHEALEAFGEDLLADMQGLLVERCGSNLRNLMAHGLLDFHDCTEPASVYLWWLNLHLVVLPLLAALREPASAPPHPDGLDGGQSQS